MHGVIDISLDSGKWIAVTCQHSTGECGGESESLATSSSIHCVFALAGLSPPPSFSFSNCNSLNVPFLSTFPALQSVWSGLFVPELLPLLCGFPHPVEAARVFLLALS